MFSHSSLLSILIWLPVFGAIAVLLTGGDKNANIARVIATIVAIANLALCIPFYLGFDPVQLCYAISRRSSVDYVLIKFIMR